MKASPTSRTLAWLRENGWTAAVVERWNPHARVRQDPFGWMDILAFSDGAIIGVQATTGAHLAARIAKAQALPSLNGWLRAGGLALFVGWSKRGPRGGRKLWTPRLIEVSRESNSTWTLDDWAPEGH